MFADDDDGMTLGGPHAVCTLSESRTGEGRCALMVVQCGVVPCKPPHVERQKTRQVRLSAEVVDVIDGAGSSIAESRIPEHVTRGRMCTVA